MATEKELALWALVNRRKLNLQATRLTWTRDVDPNLFDIQVTIEVAGRTYLGSGSAFDEDLALGKAVTEAIERAYLSHSQFPHSNGMAAHITIEAAEIAARSELIERDLFFCHFLTNTPFKSVHAEISEIPLLRAASRWVDQSGAFRLYQLSDKTAMCVVDGHSVAKNPYGFLIGTARRNSFTSAAEAACFEALRGFAFLEGHSGDRKSMSLEKFKTLASPSFRDHFFLALDLNYARLIQHLFCGGCDRIMPAEVPVDDIKFETVANDLSEFRDCPVQVVRAWSEKTQGLFLGAPTEEDLVMRRLEQFVGRSLRRSDLLTIPHPFA